MFRILALILFSCIGLVVVRDVGTVYGGYLKAEKAAEQSLDAAIVAATIDTDRQRGKMRLDPAISRQTVYATMRSNMNVDSQLNNQFYHNSSLTVDISYLGDIPRIELHYTTHVNMAIMKLFGKSEFPIEVNKKTPYLSQFL